MTMPNGLMATLLAIVATLACGTVASARSMTLYSCHTPTGRPVLTDGWKPSGSAYVGTDGCIGGALGTLGVRFGANAGAVRGWALTVPEGTSLTSFEARVCGFNGGNSTAVVSVSQRIGDTDTGLAATTATRPQIGCVAAAPWYGNAGNAIKGGGDTVRAVTARASCLESCDGNVGVDISSFRAEISDEAPPGGAVTGGSLDTSTIQTGPETLTFSAKDVGVGVYRAVVEAQINRVGAWQEVLSAPVKLEPSARRFVKRRSSTSSPRRSRARTCSTPASPCRRARFPSGFTTFA